MLNIQKSDIPFCMPSYESDSPFGSIHIPPVLWFDIKKGQKTPTTVNIDSQETMQMSHFSSVLHYGQSIFEGMKVYRQNESSVGVFRPELHARRFSKSAQAMSMIDFSPELFMECIEAYVDASKAYVPSEIGHSLYLRPLLIANDPVIKVKSSETYRFIIMGSIVGSYFKKGSKGQRILVNKDFIRAFPGGTGEAKTASNYALSLKSLEYAYAKNFEQVLYVDAIKKQKVEELGGMNFFMVKNGCLVTPELDGQILRGVTRQSILEIAQFLKIDSIERELLLSELTSGEIREIFASGTAASIAPIAELGIQEHIDAPIETFQFEGNEIGEKLRQFLTDTHIGKTEFSAKWLQIL